MMIRVEAVGQDFQASGVAAFAHQVGEALNPSNTKTLGVCRRKNSHLSEATLWRERTVWLVAYSTPSSMQMDCI